jgi:hypothetical protein
METAIAKQCYALFGMIKLTRLEQPEKQPCGSSVTPSGILTLFSLLQPLKQKAPMLVTLFGMIKLTRLEQSEKQLCGSSVTVSGILIVLILLLSIVKTPFSILKS